MFYYTLSKLCKRETTNDCGIRGHTLHCRCLYGLFFKLCTLLWLCFTGWVTLCHSENKIETPWVMYMISKITFEIFHFQLYYSEIIQFYSCIATRITLGFLCPLGSWYPCCEWHLKLNLVLLQVRNPSWEFWLIQNLMSKMLFLALFLTRTNNWVQLKDGEFECQQVKRTPHECNTVA